MNRQNVSQVLFLIISSAVAVLAAFQVGDVKVWMVVFAIATIAAVSVAYLLFQTSASGPSAAVPRPIVVPQHLKALYAERVAEAHERITMAKQKRTYLQSTLTTAQNDLAAALAASPQDTDAVATLEETVRQTQQDFDEAQANVKFEESQLDKFISPDRLQGTLEQINWASVLQYAIFASLALYVLINLMSGITTSPPAGTTPRSMITMLISVVVVGIALILVLSTIVSEKIDEKRFSQGKEVFTALLGVLGTIVGFYFGTAQDEVSGFTFEPVVVRMSDTENPIAFSTHVSGGRPPYLFSATFTPVTIPGVEKKTEGPITVAIDTKGVQEAAGISAVIVVTDSTGRTGSVEYKELAQVKPNNPQSNQ